MSGAINFIDFREDAPSLHFWSKVTEDPTSGCWIWTGAVNNHGYGQFRIDGVTLYAHRLSYEATIGPIPDGLELDHLCRVPRCLNPEHLEPVSHRENSLRGVSPAARFARATHCIQGHPFSGDNLYLRPDGKGRQCKRCSTLRAREASLRKRAGVLS